MNPVRLALMLAPMTLATGCASTLSGVGGNENYACKAPEGVVCTSIAGVYANSVQNNLPSQRVEKRAVAPVPQPAAAPRTVPIASSAVEGSSIRSAARILRLWIAPWEDTDGDLQDQSYVYVVVDSGRWLIEHRRSAIRSGFMPITAPNPAPPASADTSRTLDREPASLPQVGGAVPPAMKAPGQAEGKKDAE